MLILFLIISCVVATSSEMVDITSPTDKAKEENHIDNGAVDGTQGAEYSGDGSGNGDGSDDQPTEYNCNLKYCGTHSYIKGPSAYAMYCPGPPRTRCYSAVLTAMTYDEAVQSCAERNGTIATPASFTERQNLEQAVDWGHRTHYPFKLGGSYFLGATFIFPRYDTTPAKDDHGGLETDDDVIEETLYNVDYVTGNLFGMNWFDGRPVERLPYDLCKAPVSKYLYDTSLMAQSFIPARSRSGPEEEFDYAMSTMLEGRICLKVAAGLKADDCDKLYVGKAIRVRESPLNYYWTEASCEDPAPFICQYDVSWRPNKDYNP